MPVLDGLRGIAILFIVFFHTIKFIPKSNFEHYYFNFNRALWVGVDLFFVLSGFLITGILLETKNRKKYFKNFYMKRFLRIFPLYYLFIVFSIFVLPQLFISSDLKIDTASALNNQVWYWAYLSNFLGMKEGLTHIFLGPTWSLAIEEQFYLIWPIFVYLLTKNRLLVTSVVLIILSNLLRLYLYHKSGYSDTAIYVFTLTRLDPLLIGAVIAVLIRKDCFIKLSKYAVLVFFVSLYFLVQMHLENNYLYKNKIDVINYGYLLIAICFGSLLYILLSLKENNIISKIFSLKFLKFFGKYSYALYLFNQPIVFIVKHYIFDPKKNQSIFGERLLSQFWFTFLVLSISVVLSILSWNLFEKHFNRLKKKFN